MAPSDAAGSGAALGDVAWASILNDMEARLDGHRHALEDGTTPPVAVVVPDGTGPLPPALGARAAAVLAATRDLEAEVEMRRDAVRAAMRRAALDGGRQGAAYVDAHA